MTAVINEQLLYFSTNLYIYYTAFMHVVLAYRMSLPQNGCCNMATINITHFTTLQLNLKSHVAQHLTSSAINSNTT